MPKAKAKRNWRHAHKIKVHHNRWLAWAIAAAVLACAALIGHIQVSDVYFQNEMIYDQQQLATWASYSNRTHGYSLKYPKNWGLEAEDSTIHFNNPADPNEYFSVTVYDAADQAEIRASLFATREQDVTLNGLAAVKISQNRNQPESVIVLEDGENLYVLRGKGGNFDKIASSFKLTEKLERI